MLKQIESAVVKYWEIIADNLSKAGWSLGCVSAIDSNGRTLWIADAHRGDGKRFVVNADEILTAFLELESVISDLRLFCIDKQARFFQNWASLNGSESGGGHFPAAFFAPSGPAIPENQLSGEKRKGRKNHESIDSIKKSNSTMSRRGCLLRGFARPESFRG